MLSCDPQLQPRVSCDSLVALAEATDDGSVFFAKNSDRPASECQPLALVPAARHSPGSRVRCQYIEIPQVEWTLRVLGSRPYWLWGLEHGVNEAGVAIGNHTVFTRDKPSGEKLIGMDLVRLALERAATAEDAVGVLCDLIERYGQGGSGYHDTDFPYHSSFMVADRSRACLVETSDRHWAVRDVRTVASATNHLTIGSDWDAVSESARAHASEMKWWSGSDDGRFDFAAAFRDTSWVPPTFSSGRYRRTQQILSDHCGRIREETMRTALRDHYDGSVYRRVYPPDDERHLSVCMHADPIGTTTAAAVVRLPSDPRRLKRYSACLGPPCVGVFIPLYIEGVLPRGIERGRESQDSGLWWGFRRLLNAVEEDLPRLAPLVREAWREDESAMLSAAEALESELTTETAGVHERTTAFMEECADHVAQRVGDLRARIV